MPELGKITIGKNIGRLANNGFTKYIWNACVHCAKERWVALEQLLRSNNTGLCGDCSRHRTHILLRGRWRPSHKGNYKGGKFKSMGYVFILLRPDDFFYPMAAQDGYVREHRLVVAKALGRCLLPWETVHHKEGYAKDDNRYPETLQLVQEMQHNQITIMEKKIANLETKVEEQGKLIRLLQWQIRNSKEAKAVVE